MQAKLAWQQVDMLAILAEAMCQWSPGSCFISHSRALPIHTPFGILSPSPPVLPTHMAASRHAFVFTERELPHVQECCAGKHARQPRILATAVASAVPLHLLLRMRPRTAKGSLGTTVEGFRLGQIKWVLEKSWLCTMCPAGATA